MTWSTQRQKPREDDPDLPVRTPVRSIRSRGPSTSGDDELRPPIYSVPTTDTLGDESQLIRPYTVQTPARYRRPLEGVSAASTPQRNGHVGATTGVPRTMSTPSRHGPSGSPARRRRRTNQDCRDFQVDEDYMTVTVRSINVAQRSAFAPRPLVSMSEWHSIADKLAVSKGSKSKQRLSPSLQHLELIHKMRSMTMIRQLHFSPSVGPNNADLFIEWDNEDVPRKKNRDGRYRSIDPVKATTAVLPSAPPVLSNRKVRLPMRADVGFPKATEEEVRLKQAEIFHETEWEEASPRLVVLVTSDDLGTAVHERRGKDKSSAIHVCWNGGGLEGMPFAGKELIQAKERNAKHFGTASTGLPDHLGPNPFSMLAPPLDARYSPSQDWRPRPFHDRPAGMSYCAVCPLEVTFDVGDIEPLMCSMALYTLPVGVQAQEGQAFGKISEELWFPAGDWKGKVTLEALQTGDDSLDDQVHSVWMANKQKAIFSYDPLDLPCGRESLHVAIQVYKVSDPDGASVYFPWKGKKPNPVTAPAATARSGLVFDEFGTQLLSPLCFGVSAIVANHEDSVWPEGESIEIDLQSYPPNPESHEEFLDRLVAISFGDAPSASSASQNSVSAFSTSQSSQSVTTASHSSAAEVDEHHSIDSSATPDTAKKRRGVSRLFGRSVPRSRRLPGSERKVIPLPQRKPVSRPAASCGRAKLFSSALSSDFLQSMLSTPPELEERVEAARKVGFPTVLVDVSGDCAVLLDSHQETQTMFPQFDDTSTRRSNLLRLPRPTKPAGYVSSSEFREVLYLPARQEKQFDVDYPGSHRSLLNLLYLYPRLLRFAPEGTTAQPSSRYTVQVRLIHTESILDEINAEVTLRDTPLMAFYNYSSWAGPTLVDSMYTRPVDNSSSGFKSGVFMTDEIKVQLPLVLDGNYSLNFTLFSVAVGDSSTDLVPVAAAVVPLSTTASRDAQTTRVAFVIPNGYHRVRLGDFLLQLETRLVSAIHVSDPALATALRDFPFARGNEPAPGTQGGLIVGALQTSDSIDLDDSVPSLLSTASESAVLGSFEEFLYMHVCNLVNLGDKNSRQSGHNARFMMDNIGSLFELLRGVKAKLLAGPFPERGEPRLRAFLKKQVDAFDEGCLSTASIPSEGDPESRAGEMDSLSDALDLNQSASHDEVPDDERIGEGRDQGAIRMTSKTVSKKNDGRVSRIVGAVGEAGIPFSRVAYGASKFDRMRLEAELRSGPGQYGTYFDDDETVATSLLLPTESRHSRLAANRPAEIDTGSGSKKETGASDVNQDGNSIIRSASSQTHPADDPHHSNGGVEFAKRVRSAAQVILAPCVGPSLSNILASSRSPSNAATVAKVDDRKENFSEKLAKGANFLYNPGSDDEDEDSIVSHDKFEDSQTGCKLRGPDDGPLLIFSIKSLDRHDVRVTSGDYTYESIMVLWLRAWVDHVEKSLVSEPLDTSTLTAQQVATFSIPDYDTTEKGGHTIYAFYAHMDFLLPLCLKSMVIRYSVEVLPMYPPSTKAVVDESHMLVLEPFVELLARGLVGQALSGLGSPDDRDKALLKALSSSELVVEFLIGLLAVLHPEHMSVLLCKFFKTLRDSETEHLGESLRELDFSWTEESLHRVRCSRQLRLRAIEMLSILPSFCALNHPQKYSGTHSRSKQKKASWLHQRPEPSGNASGGTSRSEDKLPKSGWLAELVVGEGLSICALSCEAVVAEAMAHIEVSRQDASRPSADVVSALKNRPGAALSRGDMLLFQSIAIHAITAIYELLLRRHSMDRRFQTDSARSRIAALFTPTIFSKSIASARWLARMEATHKVRSLWLLCLVYILQEAPEALIRDQIRSMFYPMDQRIHRFVRLLRLCSSTFQSFVDLPRHANLPSEIDKGLSPWLLQESFNTVCAATNIVVEECMEDTGNSHHERTKVMQGLLDLLLHLLTTPQSSVTHLRAVGGALQALEQFGADLFIEITGTDLQHWLRVILSLMNSVSLSVRSVAVDFMVSLLGSTFDRHGNISMITIMCASVLPEVAAREIALFSVSGCIFTTEDAAKALWPLRRSIADLDGNPLDDDRIDIHLSPILSVFCRACQAIIDGVLIELELKEQPHEIVGSKVWKRETPGSIFDATEESLFEAACFFPPEIAPMQRIRWLLSLKSLHEHKQQWIEAAEALYLCTRTISDSLPHLKRVWRPSRFVLWSDSRRSIWLDTVGEEGGHPDRGNAQVMDFADAFLEPKTFFETTWKSSATGMLQQPTALIMCSMLTAGAKQCVEMYLRESGTDELAYNRMESLQKVLMEAMDDGSQVALGPKRSAAGRTRQAEEATAMRRFMLARKRHVEEAAAVRRVLASVAQHMTRLAERLLLIVQNEPASPQDILSPSNSIKVDGGSLSGHYVVVRLLGTKPSRFEESTTVPTFVDWDVPCICRLPESVLAEKPWDLKKASRNLCHNFGQAFVTALQEETGPNSVILRTDPSGDSQINEGLTYVHVFAVEPSYSSDDATRFVYRTTSTSDLPPSVLVEMTVSRAVPCALSRQRALLTTEIMPKVSSHRHLEEI